jgi:hypothetical protein
MSLALAWEPIDRLLDEGLEALLFQHWEEVARDRLRIPLNPDWQRARMLERDKVLWTAALRREGKLVGYNSFCVYPHIHYRQTIHATNDVIYVDPAERGIAGVKLVRGTEAMLKMLGVVKVIYHAKLTPVRGKTNTVGDLLERMGYIHFENLYSKLL